MEALSDIVKGSKSAFEDLQGGAGTTGAATLDLGRGDNTASVVVTDGSVGLATKVNAWFAGSTADNDYQAHMLAAYHVGITVVPTSGSFTIYAYNPDELTGTFSVQWRY